jgi:hypothetical protein
MEEKIQDDWFDRRKHILLPLIQVRNNTLARYISTKKSTQKKILQDTRRHPKRAKRRAKRIANREWQKYLSDKCNLCEITNESKQASKFAKTYNKVSMDISQK